MKDWDKITNKDEEPPITQAEVKELFEMSDEEEGESEGDLQANVEASVGAVGSILEHPSYRELEDKLTVAEQKAHENWDKAVRAAAELDNITRRAERDIENAHKFGIEKFMTNLLPVIDSLEQALVLETEGDAVATTVHEGLELTLKLMLDTLIKFSVTQLNPVGEVFDPQLHEAITMQENAELAPNTVMAVVQKGYVLHGRVIRAARVIVAKG